MQRNNLENSWSSEAGVYHSNDFGSERSQEHSVRNLVVENNFPQSSMNFQGFQYDGHIGSDSSQSNVHNYLHNYSEPPPPFSPSPIPTMQGTGLDLPRNFPPPMRNQHFQQSFTTSDSVPETYPSKFISSNGLGLPWEQCAPSSHLSATASAPIPSHAVYSEPYQEDKDKDWIRNFEEKINKRQTKNKVHEVISDKEKIKIHEVVELVGSAEEMMRKLKDLEKQMEERKESTGDKEWHELVDNGYEIKKSLDSVLQRFEDKTFVYQVKKLITNRRQKRKLRKKKKVYLKLEKKEQLKRRLEEDQEIDNWREKLRQEEEQKRRESLVRCEADSVLSEVRQKQNEAEQMLQVLKKVANLRQARLKKMAAHGHVSTPSADQHFVSTVERIEGVVKSQLKEYELEKQTLCVMLEGTASHKSAATGKNVALHYEDKLKKILFGDHSPLNTKTFESFTLADHCLETLAQRRNTWDTYVSDDGSPLASPVPLSWVVPPAHPSPLWAWYQGRAHQ